MRANERQVGGGHYKAGGEGEEHWDRVARLRLDYYQAQITKYIERCWLKNGLQDVEKAHHFIEKYIELIRAGKVGHGPASPPVEQRGPVVAHYEVRNHFETEGFDERGDWWRCKTCRERFMVPVGENPCSHHTCGENPTGAYVNQE